MRGRLTLCLYLAEAGPIRSGRSYVLRIRALVRIYVCRCMAVARRSETRQQCLFGTLMVTNTGVFLPHPQRTVRENEARRNRANILTTRHWRIRNGRFSHYTTLAHKKWLASASHDSMRGNVAGRRDARGWEWYDGSWLFGNQRDGSLAPSLRKARAAAAEVASSRSKTAP